jgi:hypothetical protein
MTELEMAAYKKRILEAVAIGAENAGRKKKKTAAMLEAIRSRKMAKPNKG